MKLFATMNWSEMAQGFVGVGVGLLSLAVAMQLMPKDMAQRSAGLIGVGIALNLLALSMKVFATMDWGEMAKGFAGIGGGLVTMAVGMRMMPKNMAMQAASLLILSAAMILMAKAMSSFAEMSWGDIGKSVATLAGTLLILGIAMQAMSGSLMGAARVVCCDHVFEGIGTRPRSFRINSIDGFDEGATCDRTYHRSSCWSGDVAAASNSSDAYARCSSRFDRRGLRFVRCRRRNGCDSICNYG